MELLKTEKEILSTTDIEAYITEHERPGTDLETCGTKTRFVRLWRYYKAKNATILDKSAPDPNNPDNRTPVPYARKIVTTFTGYAYRPKYITYKADEDGKESYVAQLQATFDLNREHIKTERAGRNTGIYGVAYELMYVGGLVPERLVVPGNAPPIALDIVTPKAEPRFFSVDPWEIILLYDYASEPQKQIGIRYYRITDDKYKVEQYTKTRVYVYDRTRDSASAGKWVYTEVSQAPNFFDAVPIVAYYMGDDRLGIIEPVLPLIDDYDLLVSDSLNEFDRFAHAYMVLKRMHIVPPETKKEPGALSRALQNLKRFRVFENVPDTTDPISFITKDIPTAYITYMADLIRNQIHAQSHVPDFKDMATGTLSGAAIMRLMFDFENVVASAEADFDEGLYDRIRLINTIYAKSGKEIDDTQAVVISHKRNMPDDLREYAETAQIMSNAGFSKWLIADIMPDSVIPDVEEELARQKGEAEQAMADVERQMGAQDQNAEDMPPDNMKAANA